MVTALAFSISKPFRKPIYSNLYFLVTVVLEFGIIFIVTFDQSQWVLNLFDLMPPEDNPDNLSSIPREYQVVILVTATVNAACTYFFEKVVIWYLSLYFKRREDKRAHHIFDSELKYENQRKEAY
mmetsp:Transcript_30137/g.22399  ORF Transcript_30137/g.22399 Transcript_30137/m.22399 type:complete len:125 (-) Transcript_30137:99-473(-)